MKCLSHLFQISFCLLSAAVLTQRASAITVILQPVGDTVITEKTSLTNTPQGLSTNVQVGTTGPAGGSASQRSLFKFNVAAAVPSNAIISSATLTVRVIKTPPSPTNSIFELRRVLADWTEPGATWHVRQPGIPWTVSGGAAGVDFSGTISQTNFIAGNGSYTFVSSANLVADVQDWLQNPASNFGLAMISQSQGINFTERTLDAREGATPPSLQVQYTIPATPPVLSNVMLTNTDFSFTFDTESNRTYTVEYLGDLVDTNWSTLTNFGAMATPQTILVLDPLTETNRFYRVRTP